jgi:TonB family protein
MIKTAFYIAAFYLVYSLFLSRDTLYGRNRAFVLLSLLSSLVLPLITMRTGTPVNFPLFGKTLNEVLIKGSAPGGSPAAGLPAWRSIVILIYLGGAALAGLKLLADLAGILIIISRNRTGSNRIIYFEGLNTSAFSAFGYIFINTKISLEEAGEIIKHEQNHIDNNHFFDIILIEIIKVLQWFNPFIYLFNKSLRAVHEYQADEGCLRRGIPVTSYQQLLMNQLFHTRLFTFSNSFSNPTLVKKRMIMMTKERSGILANLKLLMVLPAIAIVMIVFSSCKEKVIPNAGKSEEVAPPPPPPPPPQVSNVKEDTVNAPYVKVDVMPEFPGGDKAILGFIAKNTQYPEIAKKNGIVGKVIVRFAVEANGSIDKISILQGVDPELDAEALRVVGKLPAFEKPGSINGKPVPVWYMIPINFTLK